MFVAEIPVLCFCEMQVRSRVIQVRRLVGEGRVTPRAVYITSVSSVPIQHKACSFLIAQVVFNR